MIPSGVSMPINICYNFSITSILTLMIVEQPVPATPMPAPLIMQSHNIAQVYILRVYTKQHRNHEKLYICSVMPMLFKCYDKYYGSDWESRVLLVETKQKLAVKLWHRKYGSSVSKISIMQQHYYGVKPHNNRNPAQKFIP